MRDFYCCHEGDDMPDNTLTPISPSHFIKSSGFMSGSYAEQNKKRKQNRRNQQNQSELFLSRYNSTDFMKKQKTQIPEKLYSKFQDIKKLYLEEITINVYKKIKHNDAIIGVLSTFQVEASIFSDYETLFCNKGHSIREDSSLTVKKALKDTEQYLAEKVNTKRRSIKRPTLSVEKESNNFSMTQDKITDLFETFIKSYKKTEQGFVISLCRTQQDSREKFLNLIFACFEECLFNALTEEKTQEQSALRAEESQNQVTPQATSGTESISINDLELSPQTLNAIATPKTPEQELNEGFIEALSQSPLRKSFFAKDLETEIPISPLNSELESPKPLLASELSQSRVLQISKAEDNLNDSELMKIEISPELEGFLKQNFDIVKKILDNSGLSITDKDSEESLSFSDIPLEIYVPKNNPYSVLDVVVKYLGGLLESIETEAVSKQILENAYKNLEEAFNVLQKEIINKFSKEEREKWEKIQKQDSRFEETSVTEISLLKSALLLSQYITENAASYEPKEAIFGAELSDDEDPVEDKSLATELISQLQSLQGELGIKQVQSGEGDMKKANALALVTVALAGITCKALALKKERDEANRQAEKGRQKGLILNRFNDHLAFENGALRFRAELSELLFGKLQSRWLEAGKEDTENRQSNLEPTERINVVESENVQAQARITELERQLEAESNAKVKAEQRANELEREKTQLSNRITELESKITELEKKPEVTDSETKFTVPEMVSVEVRSIELSDAEKEALKQEYERRLAEKDAEIQSCVRSALDLDRKARKYVRILRAIFGEDGMRLLEERSNISNATDFAQQLMATRKADENGHIL